VHCGFCTATCPTTSCSATNSTASRGRIYLMKQWLEGAPVTRKTQLARWTLPDLPQLRDDLPRAACSSGHLPTSGAASSTNGSSAPPREVGALAAQGRPDLAAVRPGDEDGTAACGRCCRRR